VRLRDYNNPLDTTFDMTQLGFPAYYRGRARGAGIPFHYRQQLRGE